MRTILSRALAELNAHRSVVLVTIVAEQGSAPRGPGSQMLVGADGQLTGTIGGGQVERQSELLALSLLKEQRSQIQHFALTQAGADSLGMACGGDVTVLFQFISPEDTLWQSVLETALAQLTAAQPGWLILRTDGSAPALLDGEGMALLGSSGTAPLSKRCVLTETDFSLPLPIGERAVIFGAGHIARALVPLLRSVEFRPVVYDDRPALADPAVFPDAEQVVCGDFRNIAGTLPLSPEDYVVVMTAGHLHDLEIQEQILRQELAYVGVIGSRAKIAAVNARLREAGISEEKLRTVHTPVGTPIKAVTPAEIAVSITGEMIYERACRREDPAHHACPMACPYHFKFGKEGSYARCHPRSRRSGHRHRFAAPPGRVSNRYDGSPRPHLHPPHRLFLRGHSLGRDDSGGYFRPESRNPGGGPDSGSVRRCGRSR